MDEQHEKLKELYWRAVQYGSHDEIYYCTKELLRYEQQLIEKVKESLTFKNLLADKR